MIRELKQHPTAYGILTLFLVVSIIAFLAAWPNRALERAIAVGIGGFYVCWGVITHLKTGHVTRRVIAEYIAVGMLASLLLILVTF